MLTCPCGKEFYCEPGKMGRKRCCSKKCQYRYARRPSGLKYEVKVINKTWFKKGVKEPHSYTPPKGFHFYPQNEIKKGQHLSPDTEFKKGRAPHNFKGDDVGYHALHTWIRRKYGLPLKCEHCGGNSHMEWANRSHEYTRNRDDWIALCKRCHIKYDRALGWGVATQKYPEIRRCV
jgi:hypothetical protein